MNKIDKFTGSDIYRFICIFIFMLALFACQLGIFSNISFRQISPEVLPVCIILFSSLLGFKFGFPVAIYSVFLQKNYLSEEIIFLSWLIIPFAINFISPTQVLSTKSKFFAVLQVFLFTLLVKIIDLLFFLLIQNLEITAKTYEIIFITPVLNALLALPLVFIISKIFKQEQKISFSDMY